MNILDNDGWSVLDYAYEFNVLCVVNYLKTIGAKCGENKKEKKNINIKMLLILALLSQALKHIESTGKGMVNDTKLLSINNVPKCLRKQSHSRSFSLSLQQPARQFCEFTSFAFY